MGDAIGQRPASDVGIAISPLPVIAVILTLVTPDGHPNGIAFPAGWIGSLAAALARPRDPGSKDPSTEGNHTGARGSR
ncbi:hypothetical protein ACPCKV_27570 [Streptomyces koyangensis]|uniref:hypothetical protein n=1 Tax=Streptomyces koyangensis TaxID=188770 RepID=UPI003C2E5967